MEVDSTVLWIAFLLTIAVLFSTYLSLFFDLDPPASYHVEIPEQCRPAWLQAAEVLEAPTLQVLIPTTLTAVLLQELVLRRR